MKDMEVSIGRSSLNDLVISQKQVSSFHAKLVFQSDGSLWIYDLDSTNGVFVNGAKVSRKARVMPGDSIKLGSYSLDWEKEILASPQEAAPSPRNSLPTKKKSGGAWIAVLFVLILFGAGIALYALGIFEKSVGLISEATDSWALKNDPIVYDISCLVNQTEEGKLIKILGDTKNEVLGVDQVEVTVEEEKEVGLEVKAQIEEEYNYSQDPIYTERIDRIFSKLLSKMDNPKFDYEYHIVESEDINAFTAGGQVFVFTGIIDFAASDDELASILGHEIYHNELGHIGDKLKETKVAQNWFGEGLGDLAYYVTSLVSASFNQENEVYSDLYGLDLAVKAGYDGCAGIGFWERMQVNEEESDGSFIERFFRSHPYSQERASCNRKHIDTNYYHQCN
jgi:pSer/pThr/pTyr-binding forkhead associated (FHA) protein